MAQHLASKQTDERVTETPVPSQKVGWLAPLALILAIAAVGLGVWGLLRPSPAGDGASSEPVNTSADAASADAASGDPAAAKTEACAAFDLVRSAVSVSTHAGSDDPIAAQAVAANARLSMLGGGAYLLDRTGPATAPELSDAINKFASSLETIGMFALTGIPNDDPEQNARLLDADAASKSVAELCAP